MQNRKREANGRICPSFSIAQIQIQIQIRSNPLNPPIPKAYPPRELMWKANFVKSLFLFFINCAKPTRLLPLIPGQKKEKTISLNRYFFIFAEFQKAIQQNNNSTIHPSWQKSANQLPTEKVHHHLSSRHQPTSAAAPTKTCVPSISKSRPRSSANSRRMPTKWT